MPKMVHEEVERNIRNDSMETIFLYDNIGAQQPSGVFLPDIRRGQRLDSRARISSSCALCDTYEPIKAERAVFERVGEVKSRVSLTANCSH